MILKSGREVVFTPGITAIVGPAGAVLSAQRQIHQNRDQPLAEEAAGGEPLTPDERVEIAAVMIERWRMWGYLDHGWAVVINGLRLTDGQAKILRAALAALEGILGQEAVSVALGREATGQRETVREMQRIADGLNPGSAT
jgi:hypothetical protein